MPELVGSTGQGSTARPAAVVRAASIARPPPSATPALVERLLPRMVARGHGVETLCLYLKLAQATLLDMVVTLGLPTPHDRAHRWAGGGNRWQPDDVSLFIVLWMEGWAAASLSERFDRSKGAIWSKARHLGLPKRERHVQLRPADPHAALQPSSTLPYTPTACVPVAAPAALALPATTPAPAKAITRPLAPVVAKAVKPHSIQPVPRLDIPGVTHAQLLACLDLPPIARKGQRGEIMHSAARDLQLALRHFGSQHYLTAAREMGMSVHAYLSRRRRLELKPMPRGEFVDEFNPQWAADYIHAHKYRRIQCRAYQSRGVEFHFWINGAGRFWFSDDAKQKAWCKDAFAEINYGY